MSTMRESSRIDWSSDETDSNISTGCLQRIADATEKMATNYITLQNDRNWHVNAYKAQRVELERAQRRIAALQGVISRMKRMAGAK